MFKATDSPAAKRVRVRQADSVPLLQSINDWKTATLAQTSTKLALAKTIAHSPTRKQAMTCYANDGQLKIDNNIAERQIRPEALGRKNH